MRIHIIACGGAVMHNLTIALFLAGHQITGSDDEIYNPAKDRLDQYGLLPTPGWFPEKLTKEIDLVIIGMHAKKDNPEIAKANELGLKSVSYPEYIAQHAVNKKRAVVAGSHGKTTTTSMIMHVLKECSVDYDYLVGAPLEGFDLMIRLSDAPLMIIEGDEYLSAPTDPRPKIFHYKPQLTVITGIAWDHINVFPTFDEYTGVFKTYLENLPVGAKAFYYDGDRDLNKVVSSVKTLPIECIPYHAYPNSIKNGTAYLTFNHKEYALEVFGDHNLQNAQAAINICKELGIDEEAILKALQTFKGASKRLQALSIKDDSKIYLDFAHAPSKVKATVKAIKAQFPGFKLITLLELHTFSSLNKNFIPQYAHSLDPADEAVVFFNKHTLEIKGMPDLDPSYIKEQFGRQDLHVLTENDQLISYLDTIHKKNTVVLFMTSGTFNGVNIKEWATTMEEKPRDEPHN